MRYTPLPFTPYRLDRSEGMLGLRDTLPRVAAAQRASLGRGIAFVLVLMTSCLIMIYAPLVLDRSAPTLLRTGLPAIAVTVPTEHRR